LKARLFPGQPGPLFDEDFSDYPEHVDQATGKYGDAVQITILIWKTITGLDYGQRNSQQLASTDKELKVTKAENAFLRGQLALKNGNAKNAKRLFERALAINPAHSEAHLGLARILLNSPDQADGLVHLDHALRISTKMTPEIERLYALSRPAMWFRVTAMAPPNRGRHPPAGHSPPLTVPV
jgi:tetratricopeptide (TPR) repeat protein